MLGRFISLSLLSVCREMNRKGIFLSVGFVCLFAVRPFVTFLRGCLIVFDGSPLYAKCEKLRIFNFVAGL